MAIAEGLAAKAAIGLGALGAGATGIYFGGDYLINSLSEYDKALIKLLESDKDYDFVFSVKKGENGNEDLTDTGIVLNDTTNPLKVTVSVQIPGNTNVSSTNTLFKKGAEDAGNEDAEFQKIKDLNQKKGWTWKCTLEFGKEGDEAADIKEQVKNRMLSSDGKGLFGILKKDLSNYSGNEEGKWTKDQLKGVKANFIRQCGYSRSLSENKAINNGSLKNNNVVEANIPKFVFEKEGSELVPKRKGDFKYLFEKDYGTKKYQGDS